MASPRSVVDLLAEQPEGALRAMRDSIRVEQGRLEIEAQQIEEALAKQGRRNRGASGGTRLSRDQVLAVVERVGEPLSAADVRAILESEGVSASLNAVRNHLSRLVEQNGVLSRTPDGRFAVYGYGHLKVSDTPATSNLL